MLTVELPTADLSTCCFRQLHTYPHFILTSSLLPPPGYGFGGMLTVELPTAERQQIVFADCLTFD